ADEGQHQTRDAADERSQHEHQAEPAAGGAALFLGHDVRNESRVRGCGDVAEQLDPDERGDVGQQCSGLARYEGEGDQPDDVAEAEFQMCENSHCANCVIFSPIKNSIAVSMAAPTSPAAISTPSRWMMPSATAARQIAGGAFTSGSGSHRMIDR